MDFLIFVINFLFGCYYVLLALRAILPWLPHNRMNPFLRPVYLLTEPILSIVRAGLPPARIGMDVSPFVLIIFLWISQRIILSILQ
ncbi:MAG: YggT family protein [Candidatus Saganbacteria bacterium]|nr:YggT family protein [Candidatus Saganbacteria bacterium]